MVVESIDFILTARTSQLEIVLPQPFTIPEDCTAEIGLRNLCFYHSIPNVSRTNNSILLKIPGSGWEIFHFIPGCYEIDMLATALSDFLQFKFPEKRKIIEENFKLSADDATGKSVFTFKIDGFGVNFDTDNSIAELLGFTKNTKLFATGIHHSPNTVNISNVAYIIVNCNISAMNFMNDRKIPAIFTAVLDVAPGYRFFREQTNISYKLLNTTSFSHLLVWLSDEHHELLNLRGEEVVCTLTIRITPKNDKN